MVPGLRVGFLRGLVVLTIASIYSTEAPVVNAVPGDATAPAENRNSKEIPPLIRSARSGSWSSPTTWEGGQVPAAGAHVQIRQGHSVLYDLKSDRVVRSIHIAGVLRFDPDRDTRLDVGLIKIQAGDDASENGFDCDAHRTETDPKLPRPALEVGTPDKPIPVGRTALIRLAACDGLDAQSCPAIVCCGGRMDFHGAPMNRTWVKLGATIKKGETALTLAEPVTGWRVGDRIIITTTHQLPPGLARAPRSGIGNASEKIVKAIDGTRVTLDALEEDHVATAEFKPEVANLSRNVVVESADQTVARGHTMFHRYSAGAISYAEFRGLGKEGVLGRYSLHYHLCGDTMRGSSVIGASIWDSANRWLTIHGTNDLVVRDCIGYLSKGHGFYLEDGTEVRNVLDRNLAVQAYTAKMLPKQALPFDRNDGGGFWSANCLNTFTRNVSCGNDAYGFRFEMRKTRTFEPTLPVQQPDGSVKQLDVRTLPFIRFEDNESHHERVSGVSIGEGGDHVGPDHRHPLIVRNLKIWAQHYSFRLQSPSALVENFRMHQATYGFYYPNYDHHVYRNLHISNIGGFVFKRSNDAQGTPGAGDTYFSAQYGPLTVDGLILENCGPYNDSPSVRAMIGLADYNPNGTAVSHFRNVKIVGYEAGKNRIMVDRGPWPNQPPRKPDNAVPVFFHDYYGPGRHAKIVNTAAPDFGADGLKYHEERAFTGFQSRVAEVKDVPFPQVLNPVDDLPPATVITHVLRQKDGRLLVRGTTTDNGTVKRVIVNRQEARAVSPNFQEWEVVLQGDLGNNAKVEAHAEDEAGNIEMRPHVVAAPLQAARD